MKLKETKCVPALHEWPPLLPLFQNPIHAKNHKNDQFFFSLGKFPYENDILKKKKEICSLQHYSDE